MSAPHEPELGLEPLRPMPTREPTADSLAVVTYNPNHMEKIIEQGRVLFGIAIAASGVEGLVCARLGLTVRGVPWFPANQFLAYLIAIALMMGGICIAVNIGTRWVATAMGVLFLLVALFPELPRVIASPMDLSVRSVFFEALAISASAFILMGEPGSGARPWDWITDKLIVSAPYLFAASLLVFGIDHFLILDFIASLVPAWLPWHLFWAYLTGAAFVATGISIAVRWMDGWGAFLLGIMFAIWVLILHSPRVVISVRSHDPNVQNEWSSAFIALAMCGGCWICARYVERRSLGRESDRLSPAAAAA
jgi:uncharacterized membrane protein YphA (DoxX/SURF4 family)